MWGVPILLLLALVSVHGNVAKPAVPKKCNLRKDTAEDCHLEITRSRKQNKDITISRATIYCAMTYSVDDDEQCGAGENCENFKGSSCFQVMSGANVVIKDSIIMGKHEKNVRFLDVKESQLLLQNVTLSKFGKKNKDNGHFWGGAVRGTDSTIEIAGSTITENSAGLGGAIAVTGSKLRIGTSDISENHSIREGRAGGISALQGSTLEIFDSTVKDNFAVGRFGGGGIRLSHSNATFVDSAIQDNHACPKDEGLSCGSEADISCGNHVFIKADKDTILPEDSRLIDTNCNITEKDYTGFLCIPGCDAGVECVGPDTCGSCALVAYTWLLVTLLYAVL